jgi:hypothetical protein
MNDLLPDLPFAVIDVEASAYPLPGSFPIEVALAFVATGTVKSWLITPPEQWLTRGFWDPASESVHGISIEKLLSEGHAIEEVQMELAAAAVGHRVLSDAVGSDGYWLRALYGGPPPFNVGNIYEVIRELTDDRRERGLQGAAEAERMAALRYPERHRAGPDARRWAELLRILMGFA